MCLNSYRISQDEILTNCLTNFNADRLQIGNLFECMSGRSAVEGATLSDWWEAQKSCNLFVREIFLKQNWILQHIKGPKHTKKFTRDWVKTKQLKFLDWVKDQICRITWNNQRMQENPHISSKEQSKLVSPKINSEVVTWGGRLSKLVPRKHITVDIYLYVLMSKTWRKALLKSIKTFFKVFIVVL